MPPGFPRTREIDDETQPLLDTIDRTIVLASAFLEKPGIKLLCTDANARRKATEEQMAEASMWNYELTRLAHRLVQEGGKTSELVNITSLCEQLGLIYKDGEFFSKRDIVYESTPDNFSIPAVDGIQIATALGARLLLHRAEWGKRSLFYKRNPIRCTYALGIGFNVNRDDHKKWIQGRGCVDLGWTMGLTREQLEERVKGILTRSGKTSDSRTIRGKIFGTEWRCYDADEYVTDERNKRSSTMTNTDGWITLITDLEDSLPVRMGERPDFSSSFPEIRKFNIEEGKGAVTAHIVKSSEGLCRIIANELEVEMGKKNPGKIIHGGRPQRFKN